MGLLSAVQFALSILLVNLAGAGFCITVLRVVYQSAAIVVETKAKKQKRRRKGSQTHFELDNDVLCPCLFKNYSTVQFTMATSVSTVALFSLSCVSQMTAMAVYLCTCFGCAKSHGWPETVDWLLAVWALCFAVAYTLMFVTHFERLRLTFRHTTHRLPKWAPKLLYALLSLATVFFALSQVFYYSQPIVSAICAAILTLLYFVGATVLVAAFFKHTMAVANSTEHGDAQLTDSAMRVTVSVCVSLLSTLIFHLLWAAFLVVWPKPLFFRLLRNAIVVACICLNAFCLMCTFRHAQAHYQKVFGKLHAFFLARVQATGDPLTSLPATHMHSLATVSTEGV